MPTISANSTNLTVIVTFDVAPEEQERLCTLVREYIDQFISQQPGFVSANLHKSLCGKRVINYAQWQSMEHFKAFGAKARSRPELPELLSFGPQATFYTVVHTVESSGPVG